MKIFEIILICITAIMIIYLCTDSIVSYRLGSKVCSEIVNRKYYGTKFIEEKEYAICAGVPGTDYDFPVLKEIK